MIEKKKMSLPNIKDMEYADEVSELSTPDEWLKQAQKERRGAISTTELLAEFREKTKLMKTSRKLKPITSSV